jgi:hypothetical protein
MPDHRFTFNLGGFTFCQERPPFVVRQIKLLLPDGEPSSARPVEMLAKAMSKKCRFCPRRDTEVKCCPPSRVNHTSFGEDGLWKIAALSEKANTPSEFVSPGVENPSKLRPPSVERTFPEPLPVSQVPQRVWADVAVTPQKRPPMPLVGRLEKFRPLSVDTNRRAFPPPFLTTVSQTFDP